MEKIKTIAVFCGSRTGTKPSYMSAANSLGEALVKKNIDLVYGGGNAGLMGAVAKAVHQGGRHVTGIIPNLGWDISITYGETINVETIEERKSLMTAKADAFIALPGGFGTMNELMDVIDTFQIGLHNKPIGILNVEGYYDKLLEWVENSIAEEFMYSRGRESIITDSDPVNLIDKMQLRNGLKLTSSVCNPSNQTFSEE